MAKGRKHRESWAPNELADQFGLRREDVREAVRTGLLRTNNGRVYLDDMMAYVRGRGEIENLPSLLAHHAALQVRVMRLEAVIKFITDTIGLHQFSIDFSDEELRGLVAKAKEGVERLTAGYVACIIDVMLALTDRDLRRMDEVTGESRAWRHLIFHLEDLDDRMTARTDLMGDHRFQVLRNDLRLTISHVRTHAFFSLALTDPETDPHYLLDQLCRRASKVTIPSKRTPQDVRASIAKLLTNAAASRSS